MDYDVFVSHASEDKDRFVRPLVDALADEHLSVWFDEHELRPGDSLIQSVETGLKRSRFAIVILSPAFFEKRWPRAELDALATRELATGESVLLPVWLDVDAEAVRNFSPLLADRYAIIGTRGITYTSRAVAQRVYPGESPLVIAREELADRGISTPPPNDPWWLDAVESAAEPGDAPHSGLYRWGFPLPYGDGELETAKDRGRRLAQAVLRDAWQWEADERPITQVTEPWIVHDFINEMPGLLETCLQHPKYLACYAPQLLIPGFGGPFEPLFDDSLTAAQAKHKVLDTIGLHCESYEGQDAALLACDFTQGELMGPSVGYYETIDYFFWALSSHSSWLPEHARQLLVTGFCEWATWVPSGPNASDDVLFTLLWDAREQGKQRIDKDGLKPHVLELARLSADTLELEDDPDELADRLLATDAVELWLNRGRRE